MWDFFCTFVSDNVRNDAPSLSRTPANVRTEKQQTFKYHEYDDN